MLDTKRISGQYYDVLVTVINPAFIRDFKGQFWYNGCRYEQMLVVRHVLYNADDATVEEAINDSQRIILDLIETHGMEKLIDLNFDIYYESDEWSDDHTESPAKTVVMHTLEFTDPSTVLLLKMMDTTE